jgi:ABC-type sugar transport system permease subunit
LLLLLAAHYAAVIAGGWYAFTDWNGLVTPNFVGLRNFQQIFNDRAARLAFVNTIVLAVAVVIAVNVIGLSLALALHRAVKTRNLLRSAFFAPWCTNQNQRSATATSTRTGLRRGSRSARVRATRPLNSPTFSPDRDRL